MYPRGKDSKFIVDRNYLEGLIRELRAAGETRAITMGRKLFAQALRAAGTLDEDIRLGKLRSLGEAFGFEA